jgi:hypothetical protein
MNRWPDVAVAVLASGIRVDGRKAMLMTGIRTTRWQSGSRKLLASAATEGKGTDAVGDDIEFGPEATGARFNDGRWLLGATAWAQSVDFLISATGVLHHPRFPPIAGPHDFDHLSTSSRPTA